MKQQETMKLYNKAESYGWLYSRTDASAIFYALFQFFPSAISLRQKGFLWADDLSSFDSIYELPFHIQHYGSHISLFPILASIAIFFYMKMTTGDQQNGCSYTGRDADGKNDENHDLCFTINDVVFL
jgi:YidC/Oxa1 family membrane protein insertase